MVKRLRFFDLKVQKFFSTSNFDLVTIKGRKFAVTTSPLSKTDGERTKVSRTVKKGFKK